MNRGLIGELPAFALCDKEHASCSIAREFYHTIAHSIYWEEKFEHLGLREGEKGNSTMLLKEDWTDASMFNLKHGACLPESRVPSASPCRLKK